MLSFLFQKKKIHAIDRKKQDRSQVHRPEPRASDKTSKNSPVSVKVICFGDSLRLQPVLTPLNYKHHCSLQWLTSGFSLLRVVLSFGHTLRCNPQKVLGEKVCTDIQMESSPAVSLSPQGHMVALRSEVRVEIPECQFVDRQTALWKTYIVDVFDKALFPLLSSHWLHAESL